jgi:hypothetical protein
MGNEYFDNLATSLESAGIKKSNMFGMPVLKLGNKPICGLDSEGINFKLLSDGAEMKDALSLDGAHLFQPTMKGKKGPIMKQWVVVPFKHSEKYLDLAYASIEFVESEMK